MLTAEKTVDGSDVSESTFAYNDLGKVTSEAQTLFNGTQRTVSYGYDQYGHRTSTGYPDGSTTIVRSNTWDGKIGTLSRSGSELVDYAYIGNRTARRAYNTTIAVNTDYSYDNLGRVSDIDAGSSVVKFGYTYVANSNNIDNITFDHRTSDPYNDYDYDDIDRLTDVEYLSNSNDTESFVMDDLGNRDGNQTLRGDGTVNFTVDDDTNRYTSIAGNTITHDDAGNLTTDKDGYQHEYDCENRIIKITDVNDVEIATFDYDALNRRIRKDDKIATETTLYYYSDNWQVLAEYDDANSLQSYFVYGNYIDEPLVMNNGSDYYYLHDHLYSTAALLSASGSVAERYEYDAYGKMTMLDPDFSAWSGTEAGNPYYFTGRRLDVLDGGKYEKMQYRFRDYKTYLGRFIQPDPLAANIGGYVDGLNSYEYVSGSPLILNDMFGLWGHDIHFAETFRQSVFHVFMHPRYAARVAFHDLNVDTIHFPGTLDSGEASWHFDTDGHTEVNPSWGNNDARFVHADEEWNVAVDTCLAAVAAGTIDDDTLENEVLRRLGWGLHPLQDWFSHGTWRPVPTLWHPFPVHPTGTDNPNLDFDYTPVAATAGAGFDGILVDWDHPDLSGPPTPWPWDWLNTEDAWFRQGTVRYDSTVDRTQEYLNDFREAVRDTPCHCRLFMF